MKAVTGADIAVGFVLWHEASKDFQRVIATRYECLVPQPDRMWVAFEGIPIIEEIDPFSVGNTILTTHDAGATDWTFGVDERGEPRPRHLVQWGVPGIVIAVHDSHGLCYEVSHPNEIVAVYDHEELRALLSVVGQEWEESERGWGVRPDGYSLHMNLDDRNAFVQRHNDLPSDHVPDEYSRPAGSPFLVGVSPEIFAKIAAAKAAGHPGIREDRARFDVSSRRPLVK